MFVLYVKDMDAEAGRFATGLEAEQAMPEVAAEIAEATGLDPDAIKFAVEEVLDDADAEAAEALAEAKAVLADTLKSVRSRQWEARKKVERAEARAVAIAREIDRLIAEKAALEASLPAMRAERDEALAILAKRERHVRDRIASADRIGAVAADLRYGKAPEGAWRAKRDGRIIVEGKDLCAHASALRSSVALHMESPAI